MGRAAVFSFPSESVPQVLTKGPAFKLAPEPVSGDQTNPRVAGDDLAPCKEMLLRATAKTRPPRVCRLREEPRSSPPQEYGATPRPAGVLRKTGESRARAGPARRAQAARRTAVNKSQLRASRTLEDSPVPVSARCRNQRRESFSTRPPQVTHALEPTCGD